MKTSIFFIISIANMIFGILYRYPIAIAFGVIVLLASILFLFESDIKGTISKNQIQEDENQTLN
jgi:hypothetical protein